MAAGEQAVIFGAGILCGIACGLGADGYRAWRSAVRIGRAAAFTADCLCWCMLAASVFALLFYLNGGEVRSYFFVAMLIGYIGYRYAAGDRVVRSWQRLMRLTRRILRLMRRVLVAAVTPIIIVVRYIGALGRWLRRIITPKRKSPPEDKN